MKLFLILVLNFTILSFANLKAEIHKLPYCDLKSVWKHSAYNGPELSYLDNIKAAIDSGYCGIELDIIYDEKKKLIYISHDLFIEKKQKKKFLLSEVDEILKNEKVYLWLDWKNSNILNLNKGLNTIQSTMKSYLSKKDNLIFLETPKLTHNEIINLLNKKNNLIMLNWISYSVDSDKFLEKIKNIVRNIRAWTYVCFFSDKWVSSSNIEILSLCKNNRKVKSIFIFTINELGQAKVAFSNGSNVILTDKLYQSQINE